MKTAYVRDPEVTCWHCSKTFLCDCMDATCRMCGAPFDKSRCEEFNFKLKKRRMKNSVSHQRLTALGFKRQPMKEGCKPSGKYIHDDLLYGPFKFHIGIDFSKVRPCKLAKTIFEAGKMEGKKELVRELEESLLKYKEVPFK